MMRSVTEGMVSRPTAFLDKDGKILGDLPPQAFDREFVVGLYSSMLKARTFDAKAIALQRTGRLGTYASCLGQEAIGTGVASAMCADDVLLPSFREHAAQLIRGVKLEELFSYWGGDERGNNFKEVPRDFPVCIPVASQFSHAAGVALAMLQNGEAGAAVAIAGDGATSKGDFYEALNLIGVWNLPAVFIINNNKWAISVPRDAQTASKTLAQKALAAGISGEQVDGNDVVAVHDAASRALAKARAGNGQTLIECLSYRLSDHTTADDASRYRDEEEVSAHWKKEPVLRMRLFLIENHNWSKDEEEQLLKSCQKQVEDAADAYLASEPEPQSAMFTYLYKIMPEDLKAQAEEGENG